MSKTLSHKVEEVKKKVVHLLEQNQKLHAKNEELEREAKNLKLSLEAETAKTVELLNKIKIIKLAHNISNVSSANEEVTELKRKLNEYIREIDSCIAMLNE